MIQKGLAPILIVILIAAAVGGYLVYSGKINLNQGKPTPAYRPPDAVTMSKSQNDDTANWKTYVGTGTDGVSKFSVKYPSGWLLEGRILYPFGKNDLAYKVVLGAGGQDVSEAQEIKTFPGGSAKYYWNKNEFSAGGYASFTADKNAYIFEMNVPIDKASEYQKVFDQILSTFKFTK